MHYPVTWDPFFASHMTLADLYRYPTRHFRFHQRQLTLSPGTAAAPPDLRQQPIKPARRWADTAPGPAGLPPARGGQDLQTLAEDRPTTELITSASFPSPEIIASASGCQCRTPVVLAALSGMEREYIPDRTPEGHESARARGKSIGGAAITE